MAIALCIAAGPAAPSAGASPLANGRYEGVYDYPGVTYDTRNPNAPTAPNAFRNAALRLLDNLKHCRQVPGLSPAVAFQVKPGRRSTGFATRIELRDDVSGVRAYVALPDAPVPGDDLPLDAKGESPVKSFTITGRITVAGKQVPILPGSTLFAGAIFHHVHTVAPCRRRTVEVVFGSMGAIVFVPPAAPGGPNRILDSDILSYGAYACAHAFCRSPVGRVAISGALPLDRLAAPAADGHAAQYGRPQRRRIRTGGTLRESSLPGLRCSGSQCR